MSLLTRWPRKHLCLSEEERRHAVQAVEQAFASTLESLQVDIGLKELFEEIYVPLAAWLVARYRGQSEPLVVGINGAQGAGKSTLFNLLEVILEEGFGLRVIGFSIDDLYKTRAEREQMARQVHPLMATRGVPGTHDVELGIRVMDSLLQAGPDTLTKIPVFDKSIDDRCPPTVWQEWIGPVDVIVFEGWCVGARPQSEEALVAPVNALEAEEDPGWRLASPRQRAAGRPLSDPVQSSRCAADAQGAQHGSGLPVAGASGGKAGGAGALYLRHPAAHRPSADHEPE